VVGLSPWSCPSAYSCVPLLVSGAFGRGQKQSVSMSWGIWGNIKFLCHSGCLSTEAP
jgi:hypothetical protein